MRVGFLLWAILFTSLPAYCKTAAQSSPRAAQSTEHVFATDRQYCQRTLNAVDKLVRERFLDKDKASTVWPAAVNKHRSEILRSQNLQELSASVNAALGELHTSHCEFLTSNDEMFYFLQTLFGDRRSGKARGPLMDFSGAITHSAIIRYVLDGSPAEAAGMRRADKVLSVDGKPYAGQSSFWNTSGKSLAVKVQRGSKTVNLTLKPKSANDYHEYVRAITNSAKLIDTPQGKVAYVHIWAGGSRAHDAIDDAFSEKLPSSVALILDLRDGYGGNFYNDIDYLYRKRVSYPPLTTRNRNGKIDVTSIFYEKPVVALINGGSRSGKELLAYSLKQSGRARLVGTDTAGAVVAGQMFKLDARTLMYLAVQAGEVDGTVLEGKGVAPDISVVQSDDADLQLEKAKEIVLETLKH
jgi:carboxyl-terminal processing protease